MGENPMGSGSNLLADAFRLACREHGSHLAVTSGKRRLTYEELLAEAEQIATLLAVSFPAGPVRLGLWMRNSPGFVSAYLGILLSGHLPFLVDPATTLSELEALAAECSWSGWIGEPDRLSGLADAIPGASRALPGEGGLRSFRGMGEVRFSTQAGTRVCRFTSGTEGKPKCLEFSASAVLAASRAWVEGTGLGRQGPGTERILCLASLAGGLAFNTSLLAAALTGAELHFQAGIPLSGAVARRIAGDRITRLVAFPTLYRILADDQGPERELLAGLECAVSAGGKLWSSVRAAFQRRFGLDIHDYYGIAEIGPCTFEPETGRGRGLGMPLPGVELRINAASGDQVGEVLVRSASMASAYLNLPGRLEARMDGDGFYCSGDIGRLEEGRLHLKGRLGEGIQVGGRKVDPTEVATVVLGVEGVTDALAFEGMTNEDQTNKDLANKDLACARETAVHLAVVGAGISRKELLRVCRGRLAPYKVPSRISFVEEIPRNGMGKARLAALKARLRLGTEGEVEKR